MGKQFTFSNFEEKPKKEDIPNGYIKVKFVKQVPKFVGTDLRVYGEFNQNDVCIIPQLNAKNLCLKNACIVLVS